MECDSVEQDRAAAGAPHGTGERLEKTARSPLPANSSGSGSKVRVFDRDVEEKGKITQKKMPSIKIYDVNRSRM